MKIHLSLLAALLATTTVQGQFTCTFTGKDESSCLDTTDDDNNHCVWCSLAAIGFCVAEAQAESMEQTLPGVDCERYSGDDDDKAPKDDDSVSPPSDDSLPDDFWVCLQKKDEKSCTAADCTWCDSKQFGFGVCMTGPTADSASDSDFFTCTKKEEEDEDDDASSTVALADHVADPLDPSCLMAFLQDPTEDGCTSAVDSDGNACEFCELNGVNVCLNEEQAEIAGQLGAECPATSVSAAASLRDLQDPLDPSCLMAFLQDPTEDGCTSAVDSDGNACEFCELNGVNVCLNEEQAEIAGQLGAECPATAVATASLRGNNNLKKMLQDPLDPSCLQAFLLDPTEDGCNDAVDSDGNACQFCSFNNMPLCLNQEQAEMGEQFGLECGSDEIAVKDDPYDPTCALAFLSDPSPETCTAATDQDGQPCEYCTLQGTLNLCLTHDQAEAASALGIECNEEEKQVVIESSPFDKSCFMTLINSGGTMTPQDCVAATDNDGAPCEFCSIEGVTDSLCLTGLQAEMAEQASELVHCGEEAISAPLEDPTDPSCALAFLQDPTEDGCTSAQDSDGNGCEFCTFQDSLNLCLNGEQAQIAQTMGVECDDEESSADVEQEKVQADVLDYSCIMAFLNADGEMTPDECTSTVDDDSIACAFCSIPGVTDLCLTSMQAQLAKKVAGKIPGANILCDDANNFEQEEKLLKNQQEIDEMEELVEKKVNQFAVENPLDPACLAAGMGSDDAESVCNDTQDSEGNPCVWCNAAGVYGLCLSSEAAAMADKYLQCDDNNNNNNKSLDNVWASVE